MRWAARRTAASFTFMPGRSPDRNRTEPASSRDPLTVRRSMATISSAALVALACGAPFCANRLGTNGACVNRPCANTRLIPIAARGILLVLFLVLLFVRKTECARLGAWEIGTISVPMDAGKTILSAAVVLLTAAGLLNLYQNTEAQAA